MSGSSGWVKGGDGNLVFITIVYISALSNADDTFKVVVGTADAGTGVGQVPSAEGMYFSYSHEESSGNWECGTSKNGAATTETDSEVAVEVATWYTLKIVVNSDATEIKFYIDGSLVATHTTNLPNTNTVHYPMLGIRKSVGTTSRYLGLDTVYLRKRVSR